MIEQITFEEIYPIWKNDLWPNRISNIEPFSIMMFLGGMDGDIKFKAKPVFFAYKENGKILGVNSGHLTSNYAFRSRGVFVYPEHRGNGIAQLLLHETVKYAQEQTEAFIIWSIPKKSALKTYEAIGYEKIGHWLDKEMEFGPNCYVFKKLREY